MATAKKQRRPGYEPGRGQPDPEDMVPGTYPSGHVTHYPTTSGPVCGSKPTPTHAGDYDPETPTCPACLRWLNAAKDQTARRYPWSQTGAQAAPSTPPPPAKKE